MSVLATYYRAGIRIGFQRELQYRASVVAMLLGFLIEPVVYLAVWRTVAIAQGGSVGGYTTDELAAYYIIWTLVRVYNLGFTPWGWESRIRRGRMNDLLSQPIHPFHRDIAFFTGTKFVWTIAWVPVAAVLVLAFRPALSPAPPEILGFVVALWGGFLVRFVLLYLIGLVTFWTTRATAAFQLLLAGELLLSGRMVPLSFLPDWAERIALWLPFRWTFQYPIDVLMGRVDAAGMVAGVALQLVWAAVLGVALGVAWRRAIRRYSAVGG